jgi:fructokinase
MTEYKIGIDLGGTKTEAILFGPGTKELLRRRVPTPRQTNDDHQAILATVTKLAEEVVDQIPEGSPYSLGVGIPGILDTSTGLVQNANTTCLIGHPFKAELEAHLKHPVGMQNDANCFTLAEALMGAGQGQAMVFGIIMGTGCGAGLSINGKVHSGFNGIAGEWGHFSIDPQGAECFCGNRGCIDTKISGSGVARSHEDRFGKRLTMEEIVDGYRSGNLECERTFMQFIDDFGRSLGGLISLLDPDAVVLGGGLSNVEELYTLGIEKVRRYAFHPGITTPILRNRLGDSAGVYGAAWIGKYHR